jgi:hypothetical protein
MFSYCLRVQNVCLFSSLLIPTSFALGPNQIPFDMPLVLRDLLKVNERLMCVPHLFARHVLTCVCMINVCIHEPSSQPNPVNIRRTSLCTNHHHSRIQVVSKERSSCSSMSRRIMFGLGVEYRLTVVTTDWVVVLPNGWSSPVNRCA